jgi:HEPN domain-containing protein
MPNLNMAKEWIRASVIDLNLIKEIINNKNLTCMTAFHSQQSIEKNLKAILEYHNEDVPKIHQIKKLFNLTKKYMSIDIDIVIIAKIDTLYIESRYPSDMGLLPYGQPTLNDAKEFYDFALEIFEETCRVLTIDIGNFDYDNN